MSIIDKNITAVDSHLTSNLQIIHISFELTVMEKYPKVLLCTLDEPICLLNKDNREILI